MVQTNDSLKSPSQMRVELFMRQMSGRQDVQSIPTKPSLRTVAVDNLRANLMFEETLEAIELGLGLEMRVEVLRELLNQAELGMKQTISLRGLKDAWQRARVASLIELAGNPADMDVVGPCGTASSYGIAMEPIKALVDGNNLLKFAPGHSYRSDGKLIKPEKHPRPERAIAMHLITQGADRDYIAEDLKRVTGEVLA